MPISHPELSEGDKASADLNGRFAVRAKARVLYTTGMVRRAPAVAGRYIGLRLTPALWLV